MYQASLSHLDPPLCELEPLLIAEELDWIRRLRFERDRRRYALGRLWLRRLLAAQTGALPSEIRFRAGPHGKPAIAAPTGIDGLRFSASYSGDLVLVAVARDIEVGVDVERLRTDLDVDEIAASLFAPGELRTLRGLTGAARLRAFFTCWTRKEAYVKALGVGLSLPLDSFDVSPGLESALVPDGYTISGPAGAWSLRDVGVAAGYAAAVVAEGCDLLLPREASTVGGPVAAALGVEW